jgi:hypothetical protein
MWRQDKDGMEFKNKAFYWALLEVEYLQCHGFNIFLVSTDVPIISRRVAAQF